MLHEFLTTHTQVIIDRARAKVAARTTPVPTEAELKNGVPLFLEQLIDRLRVATVDTAAIEETATLHGGEMLAMGFSVGQVVHGYGDICQVVTQLADETDAAITTDEFHTLNRCLDDAIANSVTEYQRRRDVAVAYEGTERLGVLAHELRNRLGAAMLAFTILQEGTVGVGGSTGAMLGRSLRGMRDLVNNALAGVRIESGLGHRRRISLSSLIGEAEVEASMGADVGGFGLTVSPVAHGIDVDVDDQILTAAIGNLLQNAFKFSHPHGHIALRATATADRVHIEVEDECGGLPPGKAEDLFLPFSQRSDQRAGLGLGLTISRKGIESMGGTLSVRDVPGKGCVFAIELPRMPAA
ncbi:MAG: HAMP domain-containing sensor histidine kinase [Byssovorax sp.]